MSRLFALLTSLLAGLAGATEDIDPQWLTWNTSGFASYTWISQPDFHPSIGIVAVNGAVHYKNFSLKAQVANRPEPLRRAALEYHAALPGLSYAVQIGRVPRLSTLYSDVFGNPDEWDMAILPLAGYNRRMVHSLSFNVIDGAKLITDFKLGGVGIRASGAFGYGVQEGCEWQLEAASLGTCEPAWQLDPVGDNLNLSLEARINARWTLLTSFDRVHARATLNDPTNRAAGLLVNNIAQEAAYTYWRTGVRYSAEWGYVLVEHGENRTYFLQDLSPMGRAVGWRLQATSADDYLAAGYYLSDELTAFAGYSRGEKRGVSYINEDTFVGLAYRIGAWAATVEHHRGHGGWVRHGSTAYQWEPLVASLTYSW